MLNGELSPETTIVHYLDHAHFIDVFMRIQTLPLRLSEKYTSSTMASPRTMQRDSA
jgi:hypothetical protein